MKPKVKGLILAVVLCVAATVTWKLFSLPKHPIALLHVVDKAGRPIADAVIIPEGLRTKPGPYSGGWYAWVPTNHGVSNPPVRTDALGKASVPYPKYTLERLETGTLCLSVNHPEYVPARPEPIVSVALPAGTPWRQQLDHFVARIQNKALVTRPDPIILQKGAILKLSVKADAAAGKNSTLFAQVSGLAYSESDFWVRPSPGVLLTRRLADGRQTVRVVQFDTHGKTWFSPVVAITAVSGQTNETEVQLAPGVKLAGRLDETVPRPVRNGRVIVHVWPKGESAQNSPPEWHTWSEIRDDGGFEVASLPAGDLEIVAVCDGYVSTNGPGQFPHLHYPQKYSLDTNDLEVTVGMMPSAALEVTVTDDQGKPLKDAIVAAWPNVRYGEWTATIFGSDCYNTADLIRDPEARRAIRKWWESRPRLFQGTTTVAGVAMILDLPAEAKQFTVTHPRFVLSAVDDGFGHKNRQASVDLKPGQTNRTAVRLEQAGRSPIRHY